MSACYWWDQANIFLAFLIEFLWGTNEKMFVKNVTFHNSFNPLNNSMMQRLLPFPLCRWRTQGTERLSSSYSTTGEHWNMGTINPEIKQYTIILLSAYFPHDFPKLISLEGKFWGQRADLTLKLMIKIARSFSWQWALPLAEYEGFISPESTTKNPKT